MEAAETGTGMRDGKLLLSVDTCGPRGSVALGRLAGGAVQILGQVELEGRNYSSTLVAAIGELLAASGTRLSLLHAVVVVNGPGSFTGVRVGLSAVKGLAEPRQTPVVAVSRLAVLAWKGGCAAAALDAHRHEVFLRVGEWELLAGAEELAGLDFTGALGDGRVPEGQSRSRLLTPREAEPPLSPAEVDVRAEARTLRSKPLSAGVCDEAAAALLGAAWPDVPLVHVQAPTAGDALWLCAGRVEGGDFADLALLDGHYLRRSDAEIFGQAAKAKSGAVQAE